MIGTKPRGSGGVTVFTDTRGVGLSGAVDNVKPLQRGAIRSNKGVLFIGSVERGKAVDMVD